MIPVTYGYIRCSKSDREEKNLDTQFRILESHGIRHEHIFRDVQSGGSFRRDGWQKLIERIRPGDTIMVCWLDRFSRDFEEGVAIQAQLTRDNIGIIATEENINTADDTAAAKLFRRMMLAQGAYQRESTGERIKAGQARARAEGRPPGRPPALTPEQIDEAKRMYAEDPSVSRVARVLKVSWDTARKAIEPE